VLNEMSYITNAQSLNDMTVIYHHMRFLVFKAIKIHSMIILLWHLVPGFQCPDFHPKGRGSTFTHLLHYILSQTIKAQW